MDLVLWCVYKKVYLVRKNIRIILRSSKVMQMMEKKQFSQSDIYHIQWCLKNFSHVDRQFCFLMRKQRLLVPFCRTCSPPISLPAVWHCAEHSVTCDSHSAWRLTDSHLWSGETLVRGLCERSEFEIQKEFLSLQLIFTWTDRLIRE